MGANHTKGHGGLGRVVVLAGLLVLLGSTDILAQRWEWPEKAENLKVFPEDTSPDQLRDTMMGFVQALDVRCEHCHDDTNGNRLSQIDFPADTKENKEIARIMLKMVHRINGEALSDLDEKRPERLQVTCVTCHRGVAIPRMLGDVLAEVNAEEGTEAAIAKYRELREQYYGGFSYDFGERSLIRLAEQLVEQEKPDDAVAFLHLNLEMYPESWQTHVVFGQFYMQQEDNEQAIASLEKAYELNPIPQIQQMLDRLKSQ